MFLSLPMINKCLHTKIKEIRQDNWKKISDTMSDPNHMMINRYLKSNKNWLDNFCTNYIDCGTFQYIRPSKSILPFKTFQSFFEDLKSLIDHTQLDSICRYRCHVTEAHRMEWSVTTITHREYMVLLGQINTGIIAAKNNKRYLTYPNIIEDIKNNNDPTNLHLQHFAKISFDLAPHTYDDYPDDPNDKDYQKYLAEGHKDNQNIVTAIAEISISQLIQYVLTYHSENDKPINPRACKIFNKKITESLIWQWHPESLKEYSLTVYHSKSTDLPGFIEVLSKLREGKGANY